MNPLAVGFVSESASSSPMVVLRDVTPRQYVGTRRNRKAGQVSRSGACPAEIISVVSQLAIHPTHQCGGFRTGGSSLSDPGTVGGGGGGGNCTPFSTGLASTLRKRARMWSNSDVSTT